MYLLYNYTTDFLSPYYIWDPTVPGCGDNFFSNSAFAFYAAWSLTINAFFSFSNIPIVLFFSYEALFK